MHDECSRDFWSSIIPATLLLFILTTNIPSVQRARWLKVVQSPFAPFLTDSQAEGILRGKPVDHQDDDFLKPPGADVRAGRTHIPVWRMTVLSGLAWVETVTWLALGSYRLYELIEHRDTDAVFTLAPFILATTWMYAAIRPIVRPTATPPYDLFILFILHLISALLSLGTPLYMHYLAGWSLPSTPNVAARTCHLSIVAILLVIVLQMPLQLPSDDAKKKRAVRHDPPSDVTGDLLTLTLTQEGKFIAEEDYTSLWGWMWVIHSYTRSPTLTSESWQLVRLGERSPQTRCKKGTQRRRCP